MVFHGLQLVAVITFVSSNNKKFALLDLT